jgi:hypothetical protein
MTGFWCLGAILSEKWEHRLYAELDLDALAARSADRAWVCRSLPV